MPPNCGNGKEAASICFSKSSGDLEFSSEVIQQSAPAKQFISFCPCCSFFSARKAKQNIGILAGSLKERKKKKLRFKESNQACGKETRNTD